MASCYKSGTTLTQQIVNLLVNGVREFDHLRNLSPWVDSVDLHIGAERVEALSSPRFLKSHLPFDALPYHEQWRYIYLVRDGRDVCVSLFDQCRELEQHRPFDAHGNRVDYGSSDFSRFWDEWLLDGRPYWPLWDHIDSWWCARSRSNVLLLHFDALVGDKPAQVRRIAEFLGLPWSPKRGHMVCEHSSLEYMKSMERAGKLGKPVPKQTARFINKGTNGRWQGRLSSQQIERYFTMLYDRLEPACADWVSAREGAELTSFRAAPRVAPGTPRG
ncbi:MAG: sulfotransferase domain-containing protein [Myxococcota bacterium]